MLLDNQGLFSDRQAITGSAPSTNHINLGSPDTVPMAPAPLVRRIGATHDIPLLIQVVETFAGLTSLTVNVEVDDNDDFSSARVVASSGTVPVASLEAGYQFAPPVVPAGIDEQYVRLNYVVAGSNASAGRVTASIAAGLQSNG